MFSVLNSKIDSLDTQMKEVKQEVTDLKREVTDLKQRVTNVENRVVNVENRIIKIETSLENETNRNIKLLVDGHIQNADKLEKLDKIEDDVEYIKLKTDVLDAVTKVHSFDINHLKKAK